MLESQFRHKQRRLMRVVVSILEVSWGTVTPSVSQGIATSTTKASSGYEIIRTSNHQVSRPNSRNVVQLSESHQHTVF